jgi:hypothetical protein
MLTPKTVLEEAKAPKHPLHDRFEWDNALAAQRYREGQAGELIRSVMVTYAAAEEIHSTRAFVNVERPTGREYVPVGEVAADPLLSAVALAEAERDWRALYQRYNHLSEFIELVQNTLTPSV